ncbi:15833_t:CDS:1, partial [Gigaspora rosea]
IGHIIAKTSQAEVKRKRQTRTVYLYDWATKEDWKNYTQELQEQLNKKNAAALIWSEKQKKNKGTDKINYIWDVIEEAVLKAA